MWGGHNPANGVTYVLSRPTRIIFSLYEKHDMAKKPKKKALSKTSIKSRTSARAQSNQILSLSRQLKSVTRKQFAKVHTVWQRNMLSVESLTGGVQSYICPIPYAPGNPVGASQPGGTVTWADNLSLAAQPTYSKKAIFGVAREAATSNEIYHTGGNIQWQMQTNEASFSKYYMFLVRPKGPLADQLVKDRNLKGTTTTGSLGSGAFMTQDLDYVVHEEGLTGGTVFGAQMNPKYWTVLYKREITFGRTEAGAASSAQQYFNYNAPAGDAGGAQTLINQRGKIKLPAGGMIKNASVTSQSGSGNAAQATSWEVGYGDQSNEDAVYLVVINNGVSIDGDNATLGFIVHDYYKACV